MAFRDPQVCRYCRKRQPIEGMRVCPECLAKEQAGYAARNEERRQAKAQAKEERLAIKAQKQEEEWAFLEEEGLGPCSRCKHGVVDFDSGRAYCPLCLAYFRERRANHVS